MTTDACIAMHNLELLEMSRLFALLNVTAVAIAVAVSEAVKASAKACIKTTRIKRGRQATMASPG